jgi:hypothetical protein
VSVSASLMSMIGRWLGWIRGLGCTDFFDSGLRLELLARLCKEVACEDAGFSIQVDRGDDCSLRS